MTKITPFTLLFLAGCGYPVLEVPVVDLSLLPHPLVWDTQCPTMTVQQGEVSALAGADLVTPTGETVPASVAWYTLGRNVTQWEPPLTPGLQLACRYGDHTLPLLLPVPAQARSCTLVAWDRPQSPLDTAAAWCAVPPPAAPAASRPPS